RNSASTGSQAISLRYVATSPTAIASAARFFQAIIVRLIDALEHLIPRRFERLRPRCPLHLSEPFPVMHQQSDMRGEFGRVVRHEARLVFANDELRAAVRRHHRWHSGCESFL